VKLLARFAPPPGAAPSVVRRTGLRNALLGFFLAAFGVLLVFSLDRLSRGALLDPSRPTKLRAFSGVPLMLGVLAMVVGLYRAITGVHPERDGTSLASRIGRLLLAAMIAAAIIFGITAAATLRGPVLAP